MLLASSSWKALVLYEIEQLFALYRFQSISPPPRVRLRSRRPIVTLKALPDTNIENEQNYCRCLTFHFNDTK